MNYIKKAYYHLAYFIYKMVFKIRKQNAVITGIAYLSMVFLFNIYSILLLPEIVIKLIHLGFPIICIAPCVLVLGINYYLLLKDYKYDKIIAEYDEKFNKDRKRYKLYMFLVALYAIASVAAGYYVIMHLHKLMYGTYN